MAALPAAAEAPSGRVTLRPAVNDAAPAPEALLRAVAQQRDRAAFVQLFSHYAPRIKAHLLARGATEVVAEELAQEVMLMVWQKAAQFDPRKGSASAWIYTAARHALIDRVRHDKHPALEWDDPAMTPPAPLADDQLAAAQSAAAVREAVGQLPAEQAAVLQQAYVGGQTLQAIADQARLPLGTIKTRVRLALERLRRTLTHQAKKETS